MNERERERLQAFVDAHSTGRNPPEFFAGRAEEIEIGLSACRSIMKSARAGRGDRSGIRLFTGPPGSGKTSILQKIRSELLDGDAWERILPPTGGKLRRAGRRIAMATRLYPRPLVVFTNPENLTSVRSLYNVCIAQARWGSRDLALEESGRDVGVEAGGVKVTRVNAITRLFEKPLLRLRPAIVVMVDEVQRSTADNRKAYTLLHEAATSYKFAPLFAGLSQSAGVIGEETGISRLATCAVDRLSQEECNQAARNLLAPLQLDKGVEDAAVNEGYETSTGFPQHLNAFLIATARTALEGGLTGDSIPVIRQRTETAKEKYYSDRVRVVEFSRDELTIAARAASTILDRGYEAVESVRLAIEGVRGAAEGTRDNARAFLDKMIHCGILEQKPDEPGNYKTAIPTFARWLHTHYAEPPPKPPTPAAS